MFSSNTWRSYEIIHIFTYIAGGKLALTWPEDTAAQLRVPIAPASTPICLYSRSEADTRAHTAAERMNVYVATFLAWRPRRTRRSRSRKPSSLGCGEPALSALAAGTSLRFFALRFIAALTDNEMKTIAHAPSRNLPLGEPRQFCRVSLNMLTSARMSFCRFITPAAIAVAGIVTVSRHLVCDDAPSDAAVSFFAAAKVPQVRAPEEVLCLPASPHCLAACFS